MSFLPSFLAFQRPQGLQSAMRLAAALLLVGALATTIGCSSSPTPPASSSQPTPPPTPPTQPPAPTPLPLGTVSTTGNATYTCPAGWYSYNNGATPMTCLNATISCPNTEDIGLTFGWLNPTGIIANVTAAKGVIVLFNGGGGGPLPGNFNYADNYFNAGYEVVQAAWAANQDWEQTYFDFAQGDIANIQNAACRPATFLNYIYTNSAYFPAVQTANSKAAMCAQGLSAGSAAIAYSLVYYGASNWLDNVELVSGPVLSDLEQGCEYPNASPVTVCGQTNCSGAQCGCQLGGGSTWTLNPTYIQGAENSVSTWTNATNPACAGTTSTSAMNATWLAESIVDQSTGATGAGAVPNYNYPHTSMSGWLCRSVANTVGYDCAANNNANGQYCPNNSSTQGQIFYANFGPKNLPSPNYAVYAVDNCQHAEGVEEGNVPGYQAAVFAGTITGLDAVSDDMAGYSNGTQSIAAQCVRNH